MTASFGFRRIGLDGEPGVAGGVFVIPLRQQVVLDPSRLADPPGLSLGAARDGRPTALVLAKNQDQFDGSSGLTIIQLFLPGAGVAKALPVRA